MLRVGSVCDVGHSGRMRRRVYMCFPSENLLNPVRWRDGNMANETVLALARDAEAKRKARSTESGGEFRSMKDGETWELVKLGESDASSGDYGPQATYRLKDTSGQVFRWSVGVKNPVVLKLEEIAVNAKFRLRRDGLKLKTRYTVTPL
jgi:hypothetical protein